MTGRRRQGRVKKLGRRQVELHVWLTPKTVIGVQYVHMRSRDRMVNLTAPVNTAVLEKMEGQSDRYFKAEINDKTTELTLVQPVVPDTPWT